MNYGYSECHTIYHIKRFQIKIKYLSTFPQKVYFFFNLEYFEYFKKKCCTYKLV